MEKTHISPTPIIADSMLQFYDETRRCYLFQLEDSLPYFNLKAGDILSGNDSTPQKNDLVACSLPNKTQGIVIGKLLARRGPRILLETQSGLTTVLIVQSLITISKVL